MYQVVLKNITKEDEVIVLSECSTLASAQENRKNWRRILGGKHWTIDRRPGLDTLDHLAITIRKEHTT
jgi:hypothetical protein